MLTTAAVVVAAGLELAVGEPPGRIHPVAWLGRLVDLFDREWSHPGTAGLAIALCLPLGVGATVAGLVAIARAVEPLAGTLVAGAVLFTSTSLRMLLGETWRVVAASETDLSRAREELRSLAGRDASDLSAGQVRSAAVESAAENLADGLVAPLGGFVVGAWIGVQFDTATALALAAGGAAWVKTVNTLDSMLGYHSKSMGWGPARLDDLMMWVPARASALVLALGSGRPAALGTARSWVGDVPSPNSGWPMGVLAAALGVRLEKPGIYVLNPDASLPSVDDAERAVRIVGLSGVLSYLIAASAVALSEGVAWS